MISVLQFDSIGELKLPWSELHAVAGNGNPFLSWDWMSRWASIADQDGQTYIGVYRVGELVTALICVRLRRMRLELYGDPSFADYAGALCRPGCQNHLVAILEELSSRFSPLVEIFRPIRSVDAVCSALEGYLAARSGNWKRARFAVNPVVRIEGSFDQYYLSRGKRLRQEIRTTENRLKTMGGWEFAIGQTSSERNDMYSHLVKFHLSRQAGKVGNSIFGGRQGREFFCALLHQEDMAFAAQISVLRIGARIISAAYSLRCGTTLFYWIPSFDPTIRSASLGKLHVKCLIEYCHRDGLQCFDFMGGDEPYKFQWANETYDLYDYRAFQSRLFARAFDMSVSVGTWVKALAREHEGIGDLWRRVSKLYR